MAILPPLGMLDSLIHWKNRQIPAIRQSAVAGDTLKIDQNLWLPVGNGIDGVNDNAAGSTTIAAFDRHPTALPAGTSPADVVVV